ncbi:MAG: 4-hydroxy-3-methylbut-2-enyl diphosphate reductase, partial [Pseudomonadota bacterium]
MGVLILDANNLDYCQMKKQPLQIKMASPRGFCAGVQRAIDIVEQMLKTYGSPVYVRHQIVHNHHVVTRLKKMGAVFIEDIEQAPNDRPIVFSAHGVPKAVPQKAKARKMHYVDATCPLVSKVHREAERFFQQNYYIILIGHRFHPEVEGTMGQLPEGTIQLVETLDDIEKLKIPPNRKLAYLTQTTLSVDETKEMIDKLKELYHDIVEPNKNDICYATTNRQNAVKELAHSCDLFLIIGSANSSNSCRLVDVAIKNGCQKAFLIEDTSQLKKEWFLNVHTLGISAGASAPEFIVEELIAHLQQNYDLSINNGQQIKEDITFRLPPLTRSPALHI